MELIFGIGKNIAFPARNIVLRNVLHDKNVIIGKFGHGEIVKLFLSLLLKDLILLFRLYIVDIDVFLLAFIFGFALRGNIRLVSITGEGFEYLLVLLFLLLRSRFIIGDVLAVGHLQTAQDSGLVQ